MDPQQFLEDLLQTGKTLAEQGKVLAVEGVDKAREGIAAARERIELQIPEAGPERDALMKNLGTGAAAGGLLALLVGTKTGRKVLSPAIKLGSIAALSAVGYKVYQNWQNQQAPSADAGLPTHTIDQLSLEGANTRALNMTRAMIAAAKADGEVSAAERDAIVEHLKSSDLQDQATAVLIDEMQKSADVESLAVTVDSTEAAVEMYLASLAVIDTQNEKERAFLDSLASALQLDPQLKSDIEREAAAI